MARITEEDVIAFYWPLILQECKNSYKGLELEDRISVGAAALLQAVRTYKISYGSFKDYGLMQMRRIMKEQNTKAWAGKKIDSMLSLNTPLINKTGNKNYTFAECINLDNIDYTKLDVKHFIYSLPAKEKSIVLMRWYGLSLKSISNKLKISTYNLNRILTSIGVKLTTYYENDSYFCQKQSSED